MTEKSSLKKPRQVKGRARDGFEVETTEKRKVGRPKGTPMKAKKVIAGYKMDNNNLKTTKKPAAKKKETKTVKADSKHPYREISLKLKALRESHEISQETMAYRFHVTRSTYSTIETGARNPAYYYQILCDIFGKDEMIKLFGMDWSYYTAERLATYCVYYNVNRAYLAEQFGMAYSAFRAMLQMGERKILTKYKDKIDEIFPHIKEDDLTNFHLIGNNSLAYIDGTDALVFYNVNNNNRSKDDPSNFKKMLKELRELKFKYTK